MKTAPHFLLTAVILAATLAAIHWTDHRSPEVLARPLDSIPSQIDGWTASGDIQLRDRIAASLDATSYLSRTYRKAGQELDMFTAFYAQQKAGESMHSPKYCLPGAGWEFEEFKKVTLQSPMGPVSVNRAVIQRPGSRALMYYWYQSRTRVVASEYQSKIFLVWDGLVHANPGGSIVRVMVADNPALDREGAAFASRLVREVGVSLGSVSPGL